MLSSVFDDNHDVLAFKFTSGSEDESAAMDVEQKDLVLVCTTRTILAVEDVRDPSVLLEILPLCVAFVVEVLDLGDTRTEICEVSNKNEEMSLKGKCKKQRSKRLRSKTYLLRTFWIPLDRINFGIGV